MMRSGFTPLPLHEGDHVAPGCTQHTRTPVPFVSARSTCARPVTPNLANMQRILVFNADRVMPKVFAAFGWLSPWRGVAPTAWFYFAIRGLPFPEALRDTDGDGAPDWCEFVAGTDPENAASVLMIRRDGYDSVAQNLQISWPGVSNRFYTVESTSNSLGNWVPLNGSIRLPGTGQRIESVLSAAGVAARSFRVMCESTNGL